MIFDTQQSGLTKLLAQFCADLPRHRSFTSSAVRSAELAIADTVGCMLAGAEAAVVVKLGSTIPDEAPGPSYKSRSVRHRVHVSIRDAATVNGCAAHALELDDNVLPAIIHSSAVLTPALFALGEAIGASGSEIVRAFIVGKEVNAQIARLVNPSHYESGWHTTSTIGTIGCAAASASLLQLDSEETAHAISLAFSKASGTKLQFGSEAKALHCAFAAEGGVWAAQLAQHGLQGFGEVLQGRWSFDSLYAGSARSDNFLPALFPDAPLAIDEHPPIAKLYPCCASAHLGIGALLAIRERHGVKADDIARIDVHMPRIMCDNLRYKVPATEKEACFSMPYCAAVALVHGPPRLHHFSSHAVSHRDPAVTRLLPLVHVHAREPSQEARKLVFGGDCYVEVRLRTGDVLTQIAEHPKGSSRNPLTADERRLKFLDCAATRYAPEAAEALYADLLRISQLESIRHLTAALARV